MSAGRGPGRRSMCPQRVLTEPATGATCEVRTAFGRSWPPYDLIRARY
jgi:hypothetical protein